MGVALFSFSDQRFIYLSLSMHFHPWRGNGNPLQFSCVDNSIDRGAWWAAAHEVARVRHNLGTKPPLS